jgi:hypothetical protein
VNGDGGIVQVVCAQRNLLFGWKISIQKQLGRQGNPRRRQKGE